MGQVNSVTLQIEAGMLLDRFRKRFESKFTEPAVIDVTVDMENTKWLVSNMGYERACRLVDSYFLIEDPWVIKQGFSLAWLRGNVNKVIAQTHVPKSGTRTVYVVGFSERGFPVMSHDTASLKDVFPTFVAVPWDEWIKRSIVEKLQLPKEKWEESGNNVDSWIELWKDYGFLS